MKVIQTVSYSSPLPQLHTQVFVDKLKPYSSCSICSSWQKDLPQLQGMIQLENTTLGVWDIIQSQVTNQKQKKAGVTPSATFSLPRKPSVEKCRLKCSLVSMGFAHASQYLDTQYISLCHQAYLLLRWSRSIKGSPQQSSLLTVSAIPC